MARRRSFRRRYYAPARTIRRGYRSRKGLLSGNIGNVVWGAAAGFVDPMIPNFIGKWTKPVVFGAAGYLLKKPALLSIAGYKLGQTFTSGAGGNGSFWEG